MKSYPVKFEIIDSTGELFAKFTSFDDESFIVNIKKKILSPADIREIADELEKAEKMLKSGI